VSDEPQELTVDPSELGQALITVETAHGPILANTLAGLALMARFNGGAPVLEWTYQDAYDEEAPDAPRPVRRARLVVQELDERGRPLWTPQVPGALSPWGLDAGGSIR
jgi:hypothetical protein